MASSEALFYLIQKLQEQGEFLRDCDLYDEGNYLHLSIMTCTLVPFYSYLFVCALAIYNRCFYYWIICFTFFVGGLLNFVLSNAMPPLDTTRSLLHCPVTDHTQASTDASIIVFLALMVGSQAVVDITSDAAYSGVRFFLLLLYIILPLGGMAYFQLYTSLEIVAGIAIGVFMAAFACTMIYVVALRYWETTRAQKLRKMLHLPYYFPDSYRCPRGFVPAYAGGKSA